MALAHRFRAGRPRWLTAVVVLGLLAANPACFVEPRGEMASVRLTIDLGQLELPLTGELPGPRDVDGLLHLARVPAFVQVRVTGPDIEEPLVAAWPEEGAAPASSTVTLDLEVPAGPARAFELLAYVCDGNAVRAWANDEAIVRDLPGGLSSELGVDLAAVPTGVLVADLTGPSASQVRQVMVVDGDPEAGVGEGPAVAFPAVAVTDDDLELQGLPIGRPLCFRLVVEGGDDVLSPTSPVTLTAAGQRLEVDILVP